MTREEAIKYLENSMAIGNDDASRYHNEILEFIIEALKEVEDPNPYVPDTNVGKIEEMESEE